MRESLSFIDIYLTDNCFANTILDNVLNEFDMVSSR